MAVCANCPSCGAPVEFKSTASVFAVCEFCQSTLVRQDQALEDIGKMAALVEDRSPLQLGSEGIYKGVHFALIGRIQIRYSQGVWNEWHVLFDDMRTGWLSEAGGEYVVSFMQPAAEPLPAFANLQIGQRIAVARQTWTVSNLENAECIAGQGELPFKVGAGYPVAAADLRNERAFATLDYSETPPLLFLGEAVDFDALRMNNLREGMAIPTQQVSAQVFRCPACGSPMQARSAEILAVGCASCGAVVDTSDHNYQLLSAAQSQQANQYVPRLPLGSKGKLDGKPVEVIGFLVRACKVEGITYAWREYLLAGTKGRYRWLTEYNGHWNVADVISTPPKSNNVLETEAIRYNGETYKHFQTTAIAEVLQVTGEFTWRVRRGETNRIVDYVAPPQMLSRESTSNDLNWSLASYVEPTVIAEAFGLKQGLPDPIGVYANQPNPWAQKRRDSLGLIWKLLLAAIALQACFLLFFSQKHVMRQNLLLSKGDTELSSQEFVLTKPARKLAIRNHAQLDNNWVGLDMVLVNKTTGIAWPASREISFYSGYDDGYWSEGSRDDEVVFSGLPAGTYYLTLAPEFPPEGAPPVQNQLEVSMPGAAWSNFVLLVIFLLIFPVFALFRHAAFETSRWLESDHPPQTSSGSDDD